MFDRYTAYTRRRNRNGILLYRCVERCHRWRDVGHLADLRRRVDIRRRTLTLKKAAHISAHCQQDNIFFLTKQPTQLPRRGTEGTSSSGAAPAAGISSQPSREPAGGRGLHRATINSAGCCSSPIAFQRRLVPRLALRRHRRSSRSGEFSLGL